MNARRYRRLIRVYTLVLKAKQENPCTSTCEETDVCDWFNNPLENYSYKRIGGVWRVVRRFNSSTHFACCLVIPPEDIKSMVRIVKKLEHER